MPPIHVRQTVEMTYRVTTQVMSVGEPFDKAALAVPEVRGKRN